MPEWIPAASLRNYLRREPWIDWLNLYGTSSGYAQDEINPEIDFGQFVREKGIAFESALFELLTQRGFSTRQVESTARQRGYNIDAVSETRRLIDAGPDLIMGALVAHTDSGLFGLPDLLVRADRLVDLYEIEPEFERLFGSPWRGLPLDAQTYVPLDIKFSTIDLGAKGRITPSTKPDYQAQVAAYAWGLAEMQGTEPATALLMGRIAKCGKHPRGQSCLGWPVHVNYRDEALGQRILEAADWMRRVRREGSSWTMEPAASVPELAVKRVHEGSWHDATKKIIGIQNPVEALGELLTVELDEGPWRTPSSVEFFVDFETFNNLDDDFSTLPRVGGQSLVFMIGCLHQEPSGNWDFRCFIADEVSEAAEAKVIDDWYAHMARVLSEAETTDTRVIHWSGAEPQFFRTNYDSVANRHGQERWADPAWFDFLPIVKNGLRIRGVDGNGLKEVGKALYAEGLIQTDWGDEGVFGGTAAQVAAWKAYRECRTTGAPVREHHWMISTEKYNRADVEVMRDVVQFVRTL